MTIPRRGDVVLVLFPNSDLRTAKRRPALVIQRNNLDSGLAQTIVVVLAFNSSIWKLADMRQLGPFAHYKIDSIFHGHFSLPLREAIVKHTPLWYGREVSGSHLNI